MLGHPGSGGGGSGDDQKKKRAESLSQRGKYQTVNLQVDLGSSDTWVAATTCQDTACESSDADLYNAGLALESGEYASLQYLYGSTVAGSIYWDGLQVGITVEQVLENLNGTGRGGDGGFEIGFQAFVAATKVVNQDLQGGQYAGLLGVGLSANSIIQSIIPGKTSSQPDGAPFLDNLFGLGPGAPIGRYFTLSLERRQDPRVPSKLGLGMYDETLCPGTCRPSYSTVIPTLIGTTHWRIALQGIQVATWPDNPSVGGPTYTKIDLPPSVVAPSSSPVVVLDSGGENVLFGDRDLLNSIYAPYGIQASRDDGRYYMSCTQIISVSFEFNGVQYPVHPLDMSEFTSDSTLCMGSFQFNEALGVGDIVMGASFLRNV